VNRRGMRTPPGEDSTAGLISSCIALFVLETWSGATAGLWVIGRQAREKRRKRRVTVVKRFMINYLMAISSDNP
jgi:hypothetical protein